MREFYNGEQSPAGGDSSGNEALSSDYLLSMVRAVLKQRRFPSKIVPASAWNDEAYNLLAQKWGERLFGPEGKGWYLLDAAENDEQREAGLEQDFIEFLIWRNECTTRDNDYRALLEEYRLGAGGKCGCERLYTVAVEVADQFLRTHPHAIELFGEPHRLSIPGQRPSDAARMLAADMLIDIMRLPRKRLEFLLISNQTITEIQQGMKQKTMKWFVGDLGERNKTDHLFERAGALLKTDPRFSCFLPHALPAHSQWGLAFWVTPPSYQETDRDLFRRAFKVPVELDTLPSRFSTEDAGEAEKIEQAESEDIIGSPQADEDEEDTSGQKAPRKQRAPRILSNKALADFMADLLEEVQCTLTLDQFSRVFQKRFYLAFEVVPLKPPLNPHDGGEDESTSLEGRLAQENPALLLDHDQIADAIFEKMSERQRYIIARLGQKATNSQIANELACSPQTVSNEIHRIGLLILRSLPPVPSPDDVCEVYRQIKDRCITWLKSR